MNARALFLGLMVGATSAVASGAPDAIVWPTEVALSSDDRAAILELARRAGLLAPVAVADTRGAWHGGPALMVLERDEADGSGWIARRQLRIALLDERSERRQWVAPRPIETRRQRTLKDGSGPYVLSTVGDIDSTLAERLIASLRGNAPLLGPSGTVLPRGLRDDVPPCARYDVSWSPERSLFTVVAGADERAGTGYLVELHAQGILIQVRSSRPFIV